LSQTKYSKLAKLGVKTPKGELVKEMKYDILYEIVTTENGNFGAKMNFDLFLLSFEKLGELFWKSNEMSYAEKYKAIVSSYYEKLGLPAIEIKNKVAKANKTGKMAKQFEECKSVYQ
jgi:hypothetical protein